jgi:hypothetical protein
MRNRGTYPNIRSPARRCAALRSILGGIIMLWASIAVADAAEVRQSTRDDVKGPGQVQSDENALAKWIKRKMPGSIVYSGVFAEVAEARVRALGAFLSNSERRYALP